MQKFNTTKDIDISLILLYNIIGALFVRNLLKYL